MDTTRNSGRVASVATAGDVDHNGDVVDRLFGRVRYIAAKSHERVTPDRMPVCPRCGDLAPVGERWCVCGSRLVEQRRRTVRTVQA